MGSRRLPPRETRQPKDHSRIHALSFHAPRGCGGRSPHVERGAVLRGSDGASEDADRQPPRRRDPPRAEGAPGGTNGAWGPHPRRPGPAGSDGALGIWGSLLQDTWSGVREAAVLGEWLHRPRDAVMRRRHEEVVQDERTRRRRAGGPGGGERALDHHARHRHVGGARRCA